MSHESAAGVDGWNIADIRLLPLAAWAPIAELFQRIEDGEAQWPETLLTNRAAYLSKSPLGDESPLEESPLSELASVFPICADASPATASSATLVGMLAAGGTELVMVTDSTA